MEQPNRARRRKPETDKVNLRRLFKETGGQGVYREVESEGHEEKYRAVIDGGYPEDEPVGQRWGSGRACSMEAKAFSFSLTVPRCLRSALKRVKQRVRELTSRTRGISLARMVEELSRYLRGWHGYFGYCQTPTVLQALEPWLRRRLRSVLWKQWKRGRTRFDELRKRGIGPELAAKTAGSAYGPWHQANSPALAIALPNAYFDSLGLPRLVVGERLNSPNRRMRTRMSGGVAGARG
jgi:hypothetical protein